nr:RnfABCDGE type electron transport complex subunit D [Pseudoalteromonas sp. WY3]
MASSPHSHSHKSLTRLMLCVIAACIPGLIAQIIFFGTGVLIQLILALIAVSVFESCSNATSQTPRLACVK